MNDQSLDAITNPNPDQRAKYARFFARMLIIENPHLSRPAETYVWFTLFRYSLANADFRIWCNDRGEMGLRRFCKIVFDVWGHYLENG
jgi:hypothetical protein